MLRNNKKCKEINNFTLKKSKICTIQNILINKNCTTKTYFNQ